MKDAAAPAPQPAHPPINRLTLAAQLTEVTPLRYSPAGVPVVDCVLTHASQVLEAGAARSVTAQVKAVAMGTVAEQMQQQALGLQAVFEGFVATAAGNRKTSANPASRRLLFHIQAFTPASFAEPIHS